MKRASFGPSRAKYGHTTVILKAVFPASQFYSVIAVLLKHALARKHVANAHSMHGGVTSSPVSVNLKETGEDENDVK